ncbi:MAG: M28 family peptidase [Promethearchaeota archaeon]
MNMQFRRESLVAFSVLCGVFVLSSIVTAPTRSLAPVPSAIHPSSTQYTLNFSKANAWAYLEDIMAFNPRYPGTAGINQTRDYIINELEFRGADVYTQNYTINGVPCTNVIGKYYPQGNASGEVIILASHYDARAKADNDPDPANRNTPVPAANDGGSSTVALLDLARVLNDTYSGVNNITRETWLVFFDAEDQGNNGMEDWNWIEGSWELATNINTYLPANYSIQTFLLLDMIGNDKLQIDKEMYSNQELIAQFFSMGQCLGYESYFPDNPRIRFIIDDHKPFRDIGIPVLDIIDLDYPEWHTIIDDLDHVSTHAIGGVGRVAEAFMMNLLFQDANISIFNGETGRTWTVSSCKYPPFSFNFLEFLMNYWLVIGVVAFIVIAGLYILKKNKGN